MVKTRQHLVKGDARLVAKGTSKKSTITFHETANTSRGADANAHARLQAGGNSRQASWHWQVDDKEAVQSYRHEDRVWHAGSGALDSIAVEICVNSDGDRAKAYANAIELGKQIMAQESLEPRNCVQHYWWTKKNCPTGMRANHPMSWKTFVKRLGGESFTPKPSSNQNSSKSIEELADEVLAGEHGSGSVRKDRLGSLYSKVQAEVNRRLGSQDQKSTPSKSSVTELAQRVIAGDYGSGEVRKKALGSRYREVQAEVNRLLGSSGSPSSTKTTPSSTISRLANQVLAGQHGTGTARKRSLGKNYRAVQAEVNRRLGGGVGSDNTISRLADGVIEGKYGKGAQRKRALGKNYKAVQAEVNRRLG